MIVSVAGSQRIFRPSSMAMTLKWPTLAEAFQHFTGQELAGAHDALVDTEACLSVFRGLVKQGVIEL